MPKEPIDPQQWGQVLQTLPPFPIVLVTTRTNAITIGQIEYFTFSPLRLGIAIAHQRHTYGLLKDEREFVVNVPDASLVEAVKICGSRSGRDCDKFKEASLDTEGSAQVQAVGIVQCGANIECRVSREIEFEKRTWFIGDVVAARVRGGHEGAAALMCGRRDYLLPGEVVAPR